MHINNKFQVISHFLETAVQLTVSHCITFKKNPSCYSKDNIRTFRLDLLEPESVFLKLPTGGAAQSASPVIWSRILLYVLSQHVKLWSGDNDRFQLISFLHGTE